MKHVVLDIETIPNAEAMTRAGMDPDGGLPPWPLHQIACASVLTVDRDHLGKLSFDVRTFSRRALGERGIVASIERAIEDAFEVQTFNGAGFDIPVLLNRAAVTGEPAPIVAKLHAQPRFKRSVHVDFLQEVTASGAAPRVRLADLCAAYNIPVKLDAAGNQVGDLVAQGAWDRVANYCETDVVATWLMGLFWRSAERSSPELIVEGWTALAQWIWSDQRRLAHLMPYATVPPLYEGDGTLADIDFAEYGL
ncbi:ribonuclease H-like domain-containing protein [Sphingomonas sp. LY54]|uniref:ribonuclease H-like domain-containing protein n=1 Tax=Sphingomonas sp. LY54 TaxID=3095343 RepID=UPI002D765419|nr:ribonuclease H-like domain-containing protein [Sphingomonas sp. LY54]WRP30019.1 ribonuclease H-like domain-containing protein [Sphingomonas sp. LY54]